MIQLQEGERVNDDKTQAQNDLAILDKQIPLPAGWLYEASHVADVVHLCWPGHGAMSVHLKHRTFATGWCSPRAGVPVASGRRWKTVLIYEAVAALQKIYAPKEDAQDVS